MFHKYSLVALLLGYLLDIIVGDPHWMWHPIRGVGWMISTFEKMLRKIFPKTKSGERTAGVFLVILVVLFTTAIPTVILFFAYAYNIWLGIVIESIFCYWLFATKALKDESMKVATALENEGIEAGRYAVSMIVGRDTQSLDTQGVCKAAIETVAENAGDGVIAPLFYTAIGGAGLGFFYKAVNTMDSMVGYKNDKYQYFGTAAALFDDVLNFIPARLAAYFMIFASGMTGMNKKNAAAMFKRDRYNHASPNSAQTEAVMAGALDIQLAGDAYYFGKLHKKKFIGDKNREVEIADIARSNKLMYATSLVGLIVFGVLKFLSTLPFVL